MSRAAEARQARAEILKLARMLQREPEELAYLESVALADLRDLRERTIEVLWSSDDATMTRLAAASRLLPAALTATIAQRAFGPLLVARMSGLVEPARAVEIATKLPTGFLADVAAELDPRRASAVLAMIPPRQVAAVTRELVARGEHVAMGRFVGYLGDEAIRAALGEMDDATLLRVGFVLENKQRLGVLFAMLPGERLDRLIAAAADEGLWIEALDLLGHLEAEQRAAIVDGTADLDHAAMEAIIAAVIEHELWDEVLIVAEGDVVLQAKLAQRLPALPADQRETIARRAAEVDAIGRLGPLGEALARI